MHLVSLVPLVHLWCIWKFGSTLSSHFWLSIRTLLVAIRVELGFHGCSSLQHWLFRSSLHGAKIWMFLIVLFRDIAQVTSYTWSHARTSKARLSSHHSWTSHPWLAHHRSTHPRLTHHTRLTSHHWSTHWRLSHHSRLASHHRSTHWRLSHHSRLAAS